ncbi:UBX domain-containing protein 4 isoform X2 [Microplitis mediator]|uniref:UBX domain-containing protein 4 isoform X2 n=1 Tax=Microplitis mediator TaxID=375433 RepID=UPI0025526542|nr:UBX domain-containing protein 4 isoform X2 [Microplitis mediator]
MKWFPGSINEAVATSKTKKAVFVVFIAGNDEVSNETSRVIDSPEVTSSLEREDFVAIKLESGSESYRFFAQIYQLVPVPSLFFIGNNGKPLEIVAGSVTSSSLKEKIDSVLVKAGKKDSSNNFIKTEQSHAESTSSSNVSNTQGNSTTNNNIEEPSNITGTNVNTASANVTTASADNEITAAEKVERARKLIEMQKQQRLEEEREKERLREIERRKMGKNVQSAKRQQQDLELKLAHEERMKEKAAELEARERIRAQIAQDKIERKQREQALLQNVQEQERPAVTQRSFVGDGTARIQFRLPSGNPHTGSFQSTSTLRELRAYVVNNIELPFQQFSMSTSFPRRDLTQEDDDKTLTELQLVPTAVVLILPVKNTSSSAVIPSDGSNFISRLVWALITPLVTVFNYITGYFSGNRGPNDRSSGSRGSSAGESSRTGGVYSSGSRPNVSQAGLIRRTPGGSSTTVRALGNVHRLHSGDDDNDENNTWNGNSTQQM